MTHDDIDWKDPEAAATASHPAGDLDLSELLGAGHQLLPGPSYPFGTCEIGPTMGCCY